MQCERFELRLHQVLDERGRPEADPQLVAHAHACAACGAALDAQRMLWSVLAQADAPQPSAGFAATVVRQVMQASAASPKRNSESSRVPRARRRKQFAMAAGIAAALLLALTPAIMRTLRAPQEPGSNGPLANLPVESGATAVAEENSTPNSDAVAQANNGNAATDSVAHETVKGPTANREEHYAQILDRWRTQLPELGNTLGLTDANAPTTQGAEAVSQITARLRSPVSDSIESTLNVLRTALPSANAEQNPDKPQAGIFASRASVIS